jgi:O-antigen/teichoic acid export membrane protein
MKTHLSNAAYGVLDYAAFPIGMLLVAPILLHRLGAEQYGIWTIATASVSIGGIIASGFGDANIQYIASMRSFGNHELLLRAVRSMMGINFILGTVLAFISWMIVPFISRHVAPSNTDLQSTCLWSLRIASLLMLVRAIESVCISTQRAFERYGAAVGTSFKVRLLVLAVAAGLTLFRQGVVSIMAMTVMLTALGTWMQLVQLKKHLHAESLLPAFDRESMSILSGLGIFTWLQAVCGVIFGQADRLLLGVSLGATAVTSYALCVQIAQPIYGLTAAGLHFLFPYLTGRQAIAPIATARKTVLSAFLINLLVVSIGSAILLFFGHQILFVWVGKIIAQNAAQIMPRIVWGFFLLGLNVTGSYALLALGQVRMVTFINIAAGATMLILMVFLLPQSGVQGLAVARICYGAMTLLLYLPLIRRLYAKPNVSPSISVSPIGEGV